MIFFASLCCFFRFVLLHFYRLSEFYTQMVITVKKKATRTTEQRRLAKSRSDAMWSDIDAERTAYQSAIRRLSEKYEM